MVPLEQLDLLRTQKQNKIMKGKQLNISDIEDRVEQSIEGFKIAHRNDFQYDSDMEAYSLLYAIFDAQKYLMECAEYEIEGKKGGYQREPKL